MSSQDIVITEVEYNPKYLYFCSGRTLYRIEKIHMIRHAGIKDIGVKKKIKDYNRKLREKVFIIPEDTYKDTHLYMVTKEGLLIDAGLRYPKFMRGKLNPRSK